VTVGSELPNIPPHDCVYATRGWGIHDERWVSALLEIGRSPFVVSWNADVADALEFRESVEAAAQGRLPVLAGPLDTVGPALVGIGAPVVGLSWGYDLTNAAERGGDLSWLTALRGLVVDSEWNRGIAVEAGCSAAAVTYLPWGVDLERFVFHGPWIDAFELGVPPHAPLIVSLRAHEALYRVDDVIRAFAAVPRRLDVHEDFPDPYLVVGHEGSLTASLRRLAEDLGVLDRVRFIGRVEEDELVPLLGRAACYVTASEVDGTSVTLLQAMACGTPVVASATPGNLDWVRAEETGYTFPTGDVPALSELLAKVTARYPMAVVERARREVQQRADWHANLHRLASALDRGVSSP
jgi:glycosyltransferase involved in cell wall biosynthesis